MKNRTKYLLGILAAIVGITVLWWAFSPTSKPPVASTHSEEEGHKDEVEEEHGHAHGRGKAIGSSDDIYELELLCQKAQKAILELKQQKELPFNQLEELQFCR